MCRSIKTLRTQDHPPTEEEIHAAALQFVRKLSGYRQPAVRNADTFETAVDEVAAATRRLLDNLVPVPGKNRAAASGGEHGDHGHPHNHGDANEHAHGEVVPA